ncbi:MAG: 2OG-Fe(II) oxygenase [Pyrinomonadaceae bacterium]
MMPYSDFFTQLGLFAVKDFFSAELCASLLQEAREAAGVRGRIWKKGHSDLVVDEAVKRRTEVMFPEEMELIVKSRLLSLMPELESHFNVALTGCQIPKLVRYSKGDFYRTHVDISVLSDAPQQTKERQVAIVIFLNDEDDEPGHGSYCGGSLTFYGLVDDPRWNPFGLPLIGERGLLVAFPPNILHEVTPITHGQRYTVTSWFF